MSTECFFLLNFLVNSERRQDIDSAFELIIVGLAGLEIYNGHSLPLVKVNF
jgi:hypothetical protein